MSDELPTPERLSRIERGVSRRIDLRRLVARRIAGGSVAVLLVVGGVALLPHLGVTGGTSSGSAGSAAGLRSPDLVAVRCHGVRTVTVHAAGADLPGSAIAACAAAGDRGYRPAAGSGGARPAPSSPAAAVLCRAPDGALDLYPSGTCADHDLPSSAP